MRCDWCMIDYLVGSTFSMKSVLHPFSLRQCPTALWIHILSLTSGFPSIHQHILLHFMPSRSPNFLQSRSSTQRSSLDFFGCHSLLDFVFTIDCFIPASLAAMIAYVLSAGAKERTAMATISPALFSH